VLVKCTIAASVAAKTGITLSYPLAVALPTENEDTIKLMG
jgi:hypothetical protein